MRFQFSAGRAGGPQHSLHAQPGRKQIAENRRARSIRRKVGVEIRRLPVRDAGKNQLFDVRQNGGERLALAPEDRRATKPESVRARPAKAQEKTRCARSSRRSSPPRHVRGAGIRRESCEKIFSLAMQFSVRHFAENLQVSFVYLRVLVVDRVFSRKPQTSCPKYTRVSYSNATRPST